MPESVRQKYEQLRIPDLLDQHRGLRIVPNRTIDLVLRGQLSFQVTGPDQKVIQDSYEVEIRVPPSFPHSIPQVREIGGRIPRHYHKLCGDLLCLGAPTAIRFRLTQDPTLPTLINKFIIPYLYGHSFFLKHGHMPYGELPHGDEGIREYLARLFGANRSVCPEEFLRLAGMKKRHANKKPCLCGSGRRLGRCHNRRVNTLRKQMGRRWFQAEHDRVAQSFELPTLNNTQGMPRKVSRKTLTAIARRRAASPRPSLKSAAAPRNRPGARQEAQALSSSSPSIPPITLHVSSSSEVCPSSLPVIPF